MWQDPMISTSKHTGNMLLQGRRVRLDVGFNKRQTRWRVLMRHEGMAEQFYRAPIKKDEIEMAKLEAADAALDSYGRWLWFR